MSITVMEPPLIPDQQQEIRALNWQYLLAARTALKGHFAVACERFGLDEDTATWLRDANDLDIGLACDRAQTLFRLAPNVSQQRLSELSDNAAAVLDAADAAARLGGREAK
jgi:hypothetical protein